MSDRLATMLRWPLWSWRNLTVTAAVVLVLLALMGRVTSNGARASAVPAPATVTLTPATTTPTYAQPSATAGSAPEAPTPPASGSIGSPVAAATGFVSAWAHTTASPEAWLAGMQPWASPALLRSLRGTDPAQVPASRITGDAALKSTTGTAAAVSVPTDGGRIAVNLTRAGTRWVATALAPDDAPPGAPTPILGPPVSRTGG